MIQIGVSHNSNKCSLYYATVVYSLLLLPPQGWDGITPMLASGRASSSYSTPPRSPAFCCLLHDQSLTSGRLRPDVCFFNCCSIIWPKRREYASPPAPSRPHLLFALYHTPSIDSWLTYPWSTATKDQRPVNLSFFWWVSFWLFGAPNDGTNSNESEPDDTRLLRTHSHRLS